VLLHEFGHLWDQATTTAERKLALDAFLKRADTLLIQRRRGLPHDLAFYTD
jgi:hypothetical protein